MKPECISLWSHRQKVWLIRFPLTAWLEYLKRKNQHVLEVKMNSWFWLVQKLIWSVECFFLWMPEEPGLSLDTCSEEDLTLLAPYLVFWWICWILDFPTLVSALLRQLCCLTAWHTELCSAPWALHGQSTIALSWLVYQAGFTLFGFSWLFLLNLFVLKTVNPF